MKMTICMLMTILVLAGMMITASAETGFETLYALYCSEEEFGEPVAVYDYEPTDDSGEAAEDVKVCFAIYLFDAESDMTQAILIGANELNEQKYVVWITDYEPGAMIMTFLLNQFKDLKELCGKEVDFCVSFSFDGGETMTDIDSAEAAAEFLSSIGITPEPAVVR